MGHVIHPGPVDSQAVEEVAALCFFFNGEEILQHTQGQGLAEPPGPRNQRHRTVPVDELADKVRLIDEIIMFAPYIKKLSTPIGICHFIASPAFFYFIITRITGNKRGAIP